MGHALERRRRKRENRRSTESRKRDSSLSAMKRLEMQGTSKRRKLEGHYVDLNGYYPSYTQFVIYDDHFENNIIPLVWD